MRHLILTCCVITCLNSFSAIAQTYYADTVAGPMTDRPSRILQTNSAGTDVFVFDPDTMEQVVTSRICPTTTVPQSTPTALFITLPTNTSKPSMSSIPGPLRLSIAFSWPTAPIISPQACELEKSTSPLLLNR